MSQKINLNISPYYDDYDPISNYYQVLFKPGIPVQARELTTLQSMIQNQIERFGTHIFKEGARVTGGETNYNPVQPVVILNENFQGLSVDEVLPKLKNSTLRGNSSGLIAEVVFTIPSTESEISKPSVYINYINSSPSDSNIKQFLPGEILSFTSIDEEAQFATVFEDYPTSTGSFIDVGEGVYYIKGRFLNVENSRLLLEQYSNKGSFKVGFYIFEEIFNSDKDESLLDNSKGFNNFAAPGADRLRITPVLTKIPLTSNLENFITIKEIRNGIDTTPPFTTEYNELANEFARRTFDESGDYYVKPANISVRNTLNDLKGNNGVFKAGSTTYYNNIPSEELGTYIISPFKAYVKGFEINSKNSTYIDFKKPRATKTLENQNVIYNTGSTFTLNRVYGSPLIGIGNTYFVSLSDSRVGDDQSQFSGKEIGLARVYDFALESGSYNFNNQDINEWDISLFDIQTYTEITLNEPITLSIPTHIRGRSSGATGFIRYEVNSSGILTAYNINGNFVPGESFIFDGISNNRIAVDVKSYGIKDVKSVFGQVGSAFTFSADVKQSPIVTIDSATITSESSGISTVTSSFIPTSGISTGDIISYTLPENTIPTFSKIETISPNTFTISGITTVLGVCEGKLPQSIISSQNVRILKTNLLDSSSQKLYTSLPKENISSIDFTNSNLTIKRQFDVNIVSNSTNIISAAINEVFLPFDEERYTLVREDGITEPLSADKFEFISAGNQLRINGLGSNSTAKLITTLRKTNIKPKVKLKNKIKTLVVDKSILEGSGIGQTTLNNGLIYGNYPYGTRVEDREICLLEPDVTKIYSILESNDTDEPNIPKLTLSSISSSSGTVDEVIIGEEFIGETSNTVGICVKKVNSTDIEFIVLNSSSFVLNERINFTESNLRANITVIDVGSKDITNNFDFSSNQKETIYDLSKIIRKQNKESPAKKIKIIFESARFDSSDDGDLIAANSYTNFDYCNIETINGKRLTDIIDIRPRVSNYAVQENSRSPFEFLSRQFSQTGNNVNNILASGESFGLNYSFYLPRIDRIFVDKNGIFQVNFGIPDELPKLPGTISNSLEIASVYLPPYLCNVSEATVNLVEHKRYRMSDIKKLEDRIENLEYYTSLSLLEASTSSLQIKDFNGLDRFKSGFFVDNFSTTLNQKKVTGVKNSIDIKNAELRPTHFTTEVDLLLGNTSIFNADEGLDLDLRTNTNIVGSGIRRTGQLVTLDYEEILEISQPYASKVVRARAYSSRFYGGVIQLNPSSDIWVDQVKLDPRIIEVEGNYLLTVEQNDFDPQTGLSPITWNSWETNWTGSNTSTSTSTRNVRQSNGSTQVFQDTATTITKTGTKTRTGEQQILKESFDNITLGENTVSKEIIPYLRSRNVEFIAQSLKPFTQVFPFLGGVDFSEYVFPKLVEIEMVSGVFEVGETVKGFMENTPNVEGITPFIQFRVAQKNHKFGEYNNPDKVYFSSPYNQSQEEFSDLEENYTQNSTLINIDTFSLSNQPQGEYYGRIVKNMKLVGLKSGAEAIVKEHRLISDLSGTIIGSIFIPNPNLNLNPKFEVGETTFTLTSSPTNSQVLGTLDSFAEEIYYSDGNIQTIQENIISTRNARIETVEKIQSQDVSDTKTTTSSTLVRTIPAPPPPPPPPRAPAPPPPPRAPAPPPPPFSPPPPPPPSPTFSQPPPPPPPPVIPPAPAPVPPPPPPNPNCCKSWSFRRTQDSGAVGTLTITYCDGRVVSLRAPTIWWPVVEKNCPCFC